VKLPRRGERSLQRRGPRSLPRNDAEKFGHAGSKRVRLRCHGQA
jgi:hypothetical protein